MTNQEVIALSNTLNETIHDSPIVNAESDTEYQAGIEEVRALVQPIVDVIRAAEESGADIKAQVPSGVDRNEWIQLFYRVRQLNNQIVDAEARIRRGIPHFVERARQQQEALVKEATATQLRRQAGLSHRAYLQSLRAPFYARPWFLLGTLSLIGIGVGVYYYTRGK